MTTKQPPEVMTLWGPTDRSMTWLIETADRGRQVIAKASPNSLMVRDQENLPGMGAIAEQAFWAWKELREGIDLADQATHRLAPPIHARPRTTERNHQMSNERNELGALIDLHMVKELDDMMGLATCDCGVVMDESEYHAHENREIGAADMSGSKYVREPFITIHGNEYTRDEYAEHLASAIDRAISNIRGMNAAMESIRLNRTHWVDYGERYGLTGLERAHFNDAVNKMANTTPWTREECATILAKIMDAAQRAELEDLRKELHPNSRCSPTDPRARALRAKQHRGNGPVKDNLAKRGRVTKYKEKA